MTSISPSGLSLGPSSRRSGVQLLAKLAGLLAAAVLVALAMMIGA